MALFSLSMENNHCFSWILSFFDFIFSSLILFGNTMYVYGLVSWEGSLQSYWKCAVSVAIHEVTDNEWNIRNYNNLINCNQFLGIWKTLKNFAFVLLICKWVFDVCLYFPEKIGEAAVNDEMQPQQISLPRYMDRESKHQLTNSFRTFIAALINYLQHMLL